jgi:hypothetical protein
MDKKARFMEAVAEKVGKRQPLMRRKGKPGMAVMIAIGAPKAGMKPPMKDEGEDEATGEPMDEAMPKAKKIAMLQEKIAALKAELALLEDEDEMEDEGEMEEAEDEESED